MFAFPWDLFFGCLTFGREQQLPLIWCSSAFSFPRPVLRRPEVSFGCCCKHLSGFCGKHLLGFWITPTSSLSKLTLKVSLFHSRSTYLDSCLESHCLPHIIPCLDRSTPTYPSSTSEPTHDIVKILNLLYHAFMYSLLLLLSSIYPVTQCHSLLQLYIYMLTLQRCCLTG